MTFDLPRAPRLAPGTYIATAALVESARRVITHHTRSPIHWVDLCTIVETIFVADRIAFPTTDQSSIDWLLGPLNDAGLADPWYPEAGILPAFSDKQEAWAALPAREQGLHLMQSWSDPYYDSLSPQRRAAIDGIAHGFAEPALLREQPDAAVLLWGRRLRESPSSEFEDAAQKWLRTGLADLKVLSAEERAYFARPHRNIRDIYNNYAKHLRDLANDADATIVKSVVEEPYFDPISVEAAARDALHAVLKKNYEEHVLGAAAGFVERIPASPFGAIALELASSPRDVVPIAIDLRERFKSYRDLLSTYRELHDQLVRTDAPRYGRELRRIELELSSNVALALKNVDRDRFTRAETIGVLFKGAAKIGVAFTGAIAGNYAPAVELLPSFIRSYRYVSCKGLYQIVGQWEKSRQLMLAAQRLTGRDLDPTVGALLTSAAEQFRQNFGLTLEPKPIRP